MDDAVNKSDLGMDERKLDADIISKDKLRVERRYIMNKGDGARLVRYLKNFCLLNVSHSVYRKEREDKYVLLNITVEVLRNKLEQSHVNTAHNLLKYMDGEPVDLVGPLLVIDNLIYAQSDKVASEKTFTNGKFSFRPVRIMGVDYSAMDGKYEGYLDCPDVFRFEF